jgi:transposase-like protein
MPQVRDTTEQIIHKLREIEVVVAQGISIKQACRQSSIADNTYYKWRKEYGGLRIDQAKLFKDLEKENSRLKKLLAEAELDKAILREAASGNF